MRPRTASTAAWLVVLMVAGCSAPSAATPTSAPPADPTWCVRAGADPSRSPVRDLEDRRGDPRAGDPDRVYLTTLDAVEVPGPDVDAAPIDVEAVREFQRIGIDTDAGTIGLLVAGSASQRLEYRVAAADRPAPVLSVSLVEAELCLVEGRITSAFVLLAMEVPDVVSGVTVEARLDGTVVGRTAPLTIEVGTG